MPGLGETILTDAVAVEWIPKIIGEMVAIPIFKLTLWFGVFGVCLEGKLGAKPLKVLN
jgi:hypothetical protein